MRCVVQAASAALVSHPLSPPLTPFLVPFAASVSKNTCAQLFGAHFMAVESVASVALCFVVAPPTPTHTHPNTHTNSLCLLERNGLTSAPKYATQNCCCCCTVALLLLLPLTSFSCLELLSLSLSPHSLSLFAKLHIMCIFWPKLATANATYFGFCVA